MDVDQQHLRHCILFCFQMNTNAAQALELIISSLGEHPVRYSKVKQSFAKFLDITFSLQLDPRPDPAEKYEAQEFFT